MVKLSGEIKEVGIPGTKLIQRAVDQIKFTNMYAK